MSETEYTTATFRGLADESKPPSAVSFRVRGRVVRLELNKPTKLTALQLEEILEHDGYLIDVGDAEPGDDPVSDESAVNPDGENADDDDSIGG